jgi:hypothetical protein
MVRVMCLLIGLILFSAIAEAQNNFKEGYLIKNNGDTLYGDIRGGNQNSMSSSCVIKLNNGQILNFLPNEIRSYRFIDGKYFVSYNIEINDAPKNVFLEFLVDGIADLYLYSNKGSFHYYIQTDSDSLIELKNTTQEVKTHNGNYIREKKEYISSLKKAFVDSPEIYSDIDRTFLNHKQLISITEKYHNSVGTEYDCIIYNKSIKPNISLGITGGFVNSYVSFNAKEYLLQYLEDEIFSLTPSFTLGLLISQGNMFGVSENLKLNLHLEYRNSNYSSENFNIELNTIYLPFYFSYYFPTGKLKPYLNFGISNTFIFKSEFEGDDSPAYLNDLIGNYSLSGLFGIGAEYKTNNRSYFLLLNREVGGNIIAQNYVNNVVSSRTYSIAISFGIKYEINRK